ncbi:MAG: hypothetical protein OXU66_05050 [Gammaproteobacteria bacterium]|nr:hypothetical protein [Gammaproteobacteria bacterium]MDD9894805.1 hypothetical protein [Gammaproteobacteria bacterium]MDD9958290.1 hypothetical protein [Gammaproteobacteria bacterium]
MQNPIIKSMCAVIFSIIVSVVLFMLVEGVSMLIHPFPEDFGGSFEEIAYQVETYPTWALVLLGGVGWGGLVVICTWLATRYGHNRNPWHGYGVGIFLVGMAAYNMSMLPYPVWYIVFMLVLLPLAAYLGTKLAAKNVASAGEAD